MTEEARDIVYMLRKISIPNQMLSFPRHACKTVSVAANLIESLSDQLDQVTRELDAAVKDMYHASSDGGSFCDICVYKNNGCDERKTRDIECFEWRGVEKEQ